MKKIILLLTIVIAFTASACTQANTQKDQVEVQKTISAPVKKKVKATELKSKAAIAYIYNADADAPMLVQDKPKLQTATPMCMEIILQVKVSEPVDNQSSFRTIKEALDYAQSQNYCMVNVSAEGGTYPENLEITRPTNISPVTRVNITITGSISNTNGHNLYLENIVILNAQNYALFMMGNGTLTLKDFFVRATRRNPNDIKSGTAIELHDGVQGHFNHVNLENNDGVALYINGTNTRVIARGLNVFDNRIHLLAIQQQINDNSLSRYAAVDVAFGATLLVDGFCIYNNEITGVLARESGSVLLNNGYVAGTKNYQLDPEKYYKQYIGGNNIMTAQKGVAEMNNFESRYAESCGLFANDSYLKVQNGYIHHNAIGTCAFGNASENYDITKCVLNDTTHYHDNGVILDVPSVPIPDADCSLPDPPPACNQQSNCPGVPWVE
jgi:hypothetical protein